LKDKKVTVNFGPVVAGIIGTKKFSYDQWGNAVNTAGRMESFGTAGEIQITDNAGRLVDHAFRCEPGANRRFSRDASLAHARPPSDHVL
jgi:class 3 adenylate cyclase